MSAGPAQEGEVPHQRLELHEAMMYRNRYDHISSCWDARPALVEDAILGQVTANMPTKAPVIEEVPIEGFAQTLSSLAGLILQNTRPPRQNTHKCQRLKISSDMQRTVT